MLSAEELSSKMLASMRSYVGRVASEISERVGARLKEMDAAIKAIPSGEPGARGEPGKDVDMDAVAELISIEVKEQVGKIPPAKDGEPGKDADPEQVKLLVAAAVAELPKPKDGAPGERGPVGESIKGEKGEPGKDVHPDSIALMVREAAEKVAAALPKPKDGRDGFNLEDIQVEMGADGRTLSLKFVRGEDVVQRDIRIPAMLYRGVWREGEFERGDVVTWGGSAWHCNEKTAEKPGSGSTQWRLMVKEGRPGKDGGAPAPRGDGVVRTR